MRLQAFCSNCGSENDLGKQKFTTRLEYYNAVGEGLDYKCKSCKEANTIHLDDVNLAPGYGAYILVPVLLFAIFSINMLIADLIPGPVKIGIGLGTVVMASQRFQTSELKKSQVFNNDYIDPKRKEAQILEKNRKYRKN